MKTIVVQWVKEKEDCMGYRIGYGKEMRVIASQHPRFTVGYRFDFGFMSIVTEEGYTVVSLPMPPSENKVMENSSHNKPSAPLSTQDHVSIAEASLGNADLDDGC